MHIRSRLSDSLKDQKETFLCLKGVKKDCPNFDKVIAKTPKVQKMHNNHEWADFFTKGERRIRLELGHDFSHSVCMEEAKVNRDDFDQIIKDATIATGLSLTPFAVLRWGRYAIAAGASLRAATISGNVLKTGIIGSNIKFAHKGTTNAINKCSGALYQLDKISQTSKNICPTTSSANKINISSNLNNCIMASLIASINYIPLVASLKFVKTPSKFKKPPQNKPKASGPSNTADTYSINEVKDYHQALSMFKNRSLTKAKLRMEKDPKVITHIENELEKINLKIKALLPDSVSRTRFSKYKNTILDGPNKDIISKLAIQDGEILDKAKKTVKAYSDRPDMLGYKTSGSERSWNYVNNLEKQDNILYIGTTPENSRQVSDTLLPILKQKNIPHKVKVGKSEYMDSLKNTETQGQYITIYPRDLNEARLMVKKMDQAILQRGLNNQFVRAKGHSVGGSKLIYSKKDIYSETTKASEFIRTNRFGQAISKEGKIISIDGKPIDVNAGIEMNPGLWSKLSKEGALIEDKIPSAGIVSP